MKSILSGVFALVLVFSLSACKTSVPAASVPAGQPAVSAPAGTPAEVPDESPAEIPAEVPADPSAETPAEPPAEGLSPEFKASMDSYEAFYNDYCDFMARFSENSSDLEMLAQYADMMAQLADMTEKFEAWESEDLNDEELAYYLEVNSRITQKLLSVA